MTLFELVLRSMRKNIKHYYLYFFVFIFCTSLYFVFVTLQHDVSLPDRMDGGSVFSQAFLAAGFLLLLIVSVFTIYANRLFFNRRSREIGLYQLIGLTKRGVVQLLLLENTLLGIGALVAGIVCGALVYRIFLVLISSLLGFDGVVTVHFSLSAMYQTAAVFAVLIVLTSIQMVRMTYRTTLIDLFQAENRHEHPSTPANGPAAVFGLLGIVLILYGYWQSGRISQNTLFIGSLAILGSIIAGTYLLFRVTIGWLFGRIRRAANGHLGLRRALSLAPLMHRMRGQANSLTVITVLSAMTLTMVAAAYSFYYSAGKDTRNALPYDFAIENGESNAAKHFGEELDAKGIRYDHRKVDAIRLTGKICAVPSLSACEETTLLVLPAEQLRQTGADIPVPEPWNAAMYDGNAKLDRLTQDPNADLPKTIEMDLLKSESGNKLQLTDVVNRFAMNYNVYGDQLVVSETTFRALKAGMTALPQYEQEQMKERPDYAAVAFDTFQVPDKPQRKTASEAYAAFVPEGSHPFDYEREYRDKLQSFGLFIFITGFLGLVFLISTGSMLYFKQMTEAEQEKRSFITLRQLGFEKKDILKGIMRKQLFVFTIPLAIGIAHAAFAVKTVSVLVPSSIVVPSATAMGGYVLIYFIFVLLTMGYYKKIVKAAI
ncbi:FtsX-like permease family protein [Paenibacillus sacheonensis]|uniref:FtsX-like permease family protein n=1 Tax=Paenibacillus sacheonensis TaxID=742054 RepID=A0A7X4YPZ5_9BACL|nr:FtsX-like permease family protein [Paenibacillus sacheonensis]MBM7566130.1 bacitracin transport system permease protein [Paenibacillus sacheonensis]NBC70343.1 FtsX-like permease family protein [Paenibacillus sacheonensis]